MKLAMLAFLYCREIMKNSIGLCIVILFGYRQCVLANVSLALLVHFTHGAKAFYVIHWVPLQRVRLERVFVFKIHLSQGTTIIGQ